MGEAKVPAAVVWRMSNYRVVRLEKDHPLNSDRFVVERSTHVDAMGIETWAAPAEFDESLCEFLVRSLGVIAKQNAEHRDEIRQLKTQAMK